MGKKKHPPISGKARDIRTNGINQSRAELSRIEVKMTQDQLDRGEKAKERCHGMSSVGCK